MREIVLSTADVPGVIGGIGGFGGMFEVPAGYARPVLVSSTDGVGTKMAVAMATGRFETVGIDLVAMCVDDLVCSGAKPLFFLDYQLLGRVDPDQVVQVMKGIADGCRQAGCAIVGGELAEHPGLIEPGELDVAGFAVGIVEHDRIIDGPGRSSAGDVLIGIPSPGLRSNGYSLARKALLETAGRRLDEPAWPGAGQWTLADELLRPSVIYTPAVLGVVEAVGVHAIAHITGGGLPGNVARVIGTEVDAVFEAATWEVPPIFGEIQQAGGVAPDEMYRAFNMGIGMVMAVPAPDAPAALDLLRGAGHEARAVGSLVPGSGEVRIV